MNLADIALTPGRDPTRAAHAAFLTSAGPVTNAAFQAMVHRLTVDLRGVGIAPGDRVMLRMTNSVEFAAAFLALVWIGAVPVLQSSQFGRSELEHVGKIATPRAMLFGPAGPEDLIDDALSEVSRLRVTPEGIVAANGAVSHDAEAALPIQVAEDEPAFIVFTSGTTGRPKGIVHAHRWLEALGDSNRARIPPRPDDVALATGEWSFISALGHNVLFPLRNGIAAAVLEERATPDRILAVIARDRVTLLYSVATLYRRILGHAGIETRFDISSLRGVNSTGETLEASVHAEWQRRFGCPLWEHFGISEAQMVLGHGPGTEARPGSVGKGWGAHPVIVDDDLKPLPPDASGRLAFRSDYKGFFLGYLGDPAQTAATLRDGLFLTSDIARCDADGYVSIIGRADDCFKSKGVLIVPREIEDALLDLGLFEEACVFAVPDTEIGYRIGAALVTREGVSPADIDKASIAARLAGRIAPFKVPHQIKLLASLPKNANGKTQRRAVAQSVLG